jgi:hypothetical protein
MLLAIVKSGKAIAAASRRILVLIVFVFLIYETKCRGIAMEPKASTCERVAGGTSRPFRPVKWKYSFCMVILLSLLASLHLNFSKSENH